MPWNSLNSLKTPAKKAGGGITLTFNNLNSVTTTTVTGWKVYTISSESAITKTITASVLSDTSINIIVCGGGGAVNTSSNNAGGGGGGRFFEVQKRILASTPTQTFTCTIPAMASSTSGGTSSITFSVPTVGDISCGGGGCGSYNGGTAINAPTNGGSGGGAGADTIRGYSGGAGVFNGGSGFSSTSYGSCTVGGGGGAGGPGGNGGNGAHGGGGAGKIATLPGITSVFNSSYQFCRGGGGGYGTAGNNIGDGAGSLGPYSGRTYANGGQGAIIIAVPA